VGLELKQVAPALFALAFPIFFAAMWLAITTMLGFMSGWFALVAAFPDQPEIASLKMKGQSGIMGQIPVSMRGVLDFAVCPSGLRIGINRIFGPFSRPLFVPWAAIGVERKRRLFGEAAVLRFAGGRLTIDAHLANRLAQASHGKWPEAL
jgi:hypothetical protein